MAKEIKTWEIVNGELQLVESTLTQSNRKEKEHLEQWIKTNPKILGEDIQIIGEQVYTKSGPLDYLGIDNNGDTIIVELKRERLPRESIAQAIDYASDIANWEIEKLSEVCIGHTGQNLEDIITDKFEDVNIEDISINLNQRILLVGFGIDEPLNRMIEYLSDKTEIGINAIILNYTQTSSGDEILSRTVIIPEEVEKAKSKRKKFEIPMSDTPGEYEESKLRELLIKYLTKDLWSAMRIREVILPALLENQVMTRESFKPIFVAKGKADSEPQAGSFLSLISKQLGAERNDFLRQVIHYSYPNNFWEKDNFSILPDYTKLVREILEEISQ